MWLNQKTLTWCKCGKQEWISLLRKRFKKHNKEMFCFANNFFFFLSLSSLNDARAFPSHHGELPSWRGKWLQRTHLQLQKISQRSTAMQRDRRKRSALAFEEPSLGHVHAQRNLPKIANINLMQIILKLENRQVSHVLTH